MDEFLGANPQLFHLHKFASNPNALKVDEMEELHKPSVVDFYIVALPGAALLGAVLAVVLSWF